MIWAGSCRIQLEYGKVKIMREWFVYFPPASFIPQIIPVTIADTDALLTFFYLTIGCESVETVRFGSSSEVLVCDEEGLFQENPKANFIGSALYTGIIVGGVIIAKEGKRNGEPDLLGFDTLQEAAAAAQAARTIAEMKYSGLLYP